MIQVWITKKSNLNLSKQTQATNCFIFFLRFLCRHCVVCPVVRPTFICGTDNTTYSSPCKLDYTNCMNDSDVKVACKGFCPCPSKWQRKKEKHAMRLSQFEKKYKSTVDGKKDTAVKPKVIFAPDVAKFKMELFGKKANSKGGILNSADNQKKGFNDVLPRKKDTPMNGR